MLKVLETQVTSDYFTFQINVNAQYFYEIVNLIEAKVKQPPSLSTSQKKKLFEKKRKPLKLNYPCYNQRVEKPVRLVTEASTQV